MHRPWMPLVAALAFGALHGLGPDHAAAVLVLSSRGRSMGAALAAAARFALGHGAVFAAAGLAAPLLLDHLPARFDQAMEVLGGACLMLIGAASLAGSFGVHLHRLHLSGAAHLHRHRPGGDETSRHPHAHRALDGGVGALFALSSLRVFAVQGHVAGGAWFGLGLAAAFAAGVCASMAGVALLLAGSRAVFPSARLGLTRLAGAAALGTGAVWIALNR